MTRQSFLDYCESLEGAVLDRPFQGDFETTVARHGRNLKWFAILMKKDGADFANLKCGFGQPGLLRFMFQGIRPAWHMNKDHWVSVYLDSDVPEPFIRQLVLNSYRLTAPKLVQRKRKQKDDY